MHVPQVIEHKREGGELSEAEVRWIVGEFTAGRIPDYQMAALAMAIFFRGMSDAETAVLTAAMRDSGRVFKYPDRTPPKVDKHSTGGIGDKVSLILAPLLACDHLWVPMVSGRGLGITGGTLDKLEAIPGFSVHLDEGACLRQLEAIGVFMAGQTEDFCPADKRLYALRDVTGTVPSKPLIVASIMSKKLAESLDRLVLDVKFGSGAFMKTRAEADDLAGALVAAGEANGVATSHRLTAMEEPLGRTVGNALEVAEAVDALRGGGPPDLVGLTLDLAAAVADSPREALAEMLRDGRAWEKFVALVEAQGGDATATERIADVHAAPVVRPVCARAAGTVAAFDAGAVGRASVALGAGRKHAGDAVDFSVGLSGIAKIGAAVEAGEPLAFVHARSENDWERAAAAVEAAVTIS